ncbi:LysR substrate-binding domain-containing protein [Novosphingobium sp. PS1R-30]|uniref:LysR substrate-binding domain-containing protein n=1 Tax=Novosphingobium anseongense TaxID=3133436 RepID=A0ABU8RXZ0_9SPHN
MSLPPLAAVRVFEAAARHENYSRAAEELALTQAGVSYQIKLLEERIGAQLFTRKGRGVALTSLGKRIAPRVSEAFSLLGEAFSAAQAENEAVLSITCSRTFATNWLAERIGAFNLTKPGLAVRLHVSDEVVDLAAGEIDVAIRGVIDPGPGVVTHFLVRQIITPMASPEFLARNPISTPADLRKVTRLSPNDEWWDTWFASLSDGYDGAHDPGLRFDSQVLDGQAAIAGHGVAMIFPPMFPDAIAAGRLVAPFDHYAVEARTMWLVYPEHKRNLAKVRAFRDWLLPAIRESLGDDPLGALVHPKDA